jgi:hypothetical protein
VFHDHLVRTPVLTIYIIRDLSIESVLTNLRFSDQSFGNRKYPLREASSQTRQRVTQRCGHQNIDDTSGD